MMPITDGLPLWPVLLGCGVIVALWIEWCILRALCHALLDAVDDLDWD